jgi:hypothetical protein
MPSRTICYRFLPGLFLFAVILTAAVHGGDQTNSGKSAVKAKDTASGLLTDFKDDSITVLLDGDDEPTKFLLGNGISKQDLTKRQIFPVDRVNLKFKLDGEDRKLVAIEKVPGRPTGVAVGKVIKVYNNFWIAVKPNNGGMIEGFALNWPPEKFKQSHDLIKTLKPGDVVAIKYATDFERHRILQIELKPPNKSK